MRSSRATRCTTRSRSSSVASSGGRSRIESNALIPHDSEVKTRALCASTAGLHRQAHSSRKCRLELSPGSVAGCSIRSDRGGVADSDRAAEENYDAAAPLLQATRR